MPRRKFNLARTSRRRFRRYRKFRGNRLSSHTNLRSFPSTKRVMMRYTDYVSLTAQVITPLPTYVFRMNSCFDPDFSFIGHQPLGYDQWKTFYNSYCVIGAKITWQPETTNSVNTPVIAGIFLSNNSTVTATSGLTLVEQGNCQYRTFQGVTNANGGVNKTLVSQRYSARKWHNVKDIRDVSSQTADVGSNPADAVYGIIFLSAYDGTSQTANCAGIVNIDYIVEFSDPKELAQS